MNTCQKAPGEILCAKPTSRPQDRTARPAVRRSTLVVVPLLLLAYLLQCAWFIRTQSFTVDESDHIIAGLEGWRYGEFERWHDQPPLARLLFALPLLRTNWRYENRAPGGGSGPNHIGSKMDDEQEDAVIVQNGPDPNWHLSDEAIPLQPAPEVWLYRARSMNVLLGVSLLLLLWFTTRRMFSEGAANFALALAAMSPELVAHYSLATIDGAATLFFFAAIVQLARWLRQPSGGQTLLLGVALGAMLIAKLSMPPFFLLALLMILILRPAASSEAQRFPALSLICNPFRWNWKQAATACVAAFLFVWSAYFFHVTKVIFDPGKVTLHFAGYFQSLTYPIPVSMHMRLWIPACEYLTGLGQVILHNSDGHRSFFLGHPSLTGGWKLYFPVAVLLKWPAIILLLAVAGIVLVSRNRVPGRGELLFLSIFPAVYFATVIFGRLNIGVRHVLPVYPFVLLYAAAVWEWARNRKKAKVLLLGLLCLQAVDVLRYAPDYLSYFNVFIKPSESYRYLSDSNLDWGQGLVALRKYQAEHPGQMLHLAYNGLVDPAWYGIRYVPMGEADHPTGTVIVSATHLSGQLLNDPNAYHWLLQYPVKRILNHTLYVFEVPQ